ncbi:MAG: ATP-binding cassette domain-containing protein [Methanosarcinales archaeon]|nr:ATP-binding cassette domain-containing protein [Methanosarcinales archaeon]
MISIENLTYYYPGFEDAVLDNINLTVEEGEFILLLGPSGCGKSTLVQCLNGIIPKVSSGDLSGEIFINKKNVRDYKVYQLSTDVGLVFQNPDTQLFGLTVEEDVAFGPENLGIEREGIRARVKHSLETVGLEDFKDRFTFTLSGGEKQRTAIAGNLAMEPKILVLDEPTSDLDPAGTKEVFETLKHLNRDRKITIILIEHKIDEVMGLADRSVVMDKGRIILDGNTFDIFSRNLDVLEEIGIHLPQLMRISSLLGVRPSYDDIVSGLGSLDGSLDLPATSRPAMGVPQVVFENVEFGYPDGNLALKGVNLEIKRGEFVALIGPNGSGKTTLLSCLIGLNRPTAGRILINGQDIRKRGVAEQAQVVGYLFQNPDYQLFTDSVHEEVAFGLKNRQSRPDDIEKRVDQALEMMELSEYRDRHPHSLSRGQRQRLAVASILSMEPDIIILDEPTTGQDRGHLNKFLARMKMLNEAGKTIILISHDMGVVAEYASRTIVMKDGGILMDAGTREVFSRPDILEEASIEPHLLARACNDVREGGRDIPVLLTVGELERYVG